MQCPVYRITPLVSVTFPSHYFFRVYHLIHLFLFFSTMATATTKASATRASKAAKASLIPTSFGSNGKFIRYNLKLATAALKKEFPGYDDVRLTTYIGGHTYINLGSERDDSIAPVVKTASQMKEFLAKHGLQNVTDASVF